MKGMAPGQDFFYKPAILLQIFASIYHLMIQVNPDNSVYILSGLPFIRHGSH